MGLVMGDWDILDHSIELGFKNEVVERGSAAFGVVSSVNAAIMGLGGIGLSLDMVGALLDGGEEVVEGSMC